MWIDVSGSTALLGGLLGYCNNYLNHPLFVYILILKAADRQTQMVTDKNRTRFAQKYHTFLYVQIYKSLTYI